MSTRRRLVLAAAAALLAPPAGAADVVHDVVPLALGGELLSWAHGDVDGDGRAELVVAVRPRASTRRELRVLGWGGDGRLQPEPRTTLPVLDDVVAFCLADVRDEPGAELLLLTRGGAFSLSLTREGYRGNAERLVETELLYDMPDPGSLPLWDYVLGAGGGKALLLLPERKGFSVWGPAPPPTSDGDATAAGAAAPPPGYALRMRVVLDVDGDGDGLGPRRVRGELGFGGGGFSVTAGRDHGVLLDSELPILGERLLAADLRHRSPALVEVDGDGRPDVVVRRDDALHVFLQGAAGPHETADRIEPLPDYLQDGGNLTLAFHDLDADGDGDLLARLERDDGGAFDTSSTFDLLVLRNDGARLLPEAPHQLLRLEGTELRASLADTNGDGLPDLVVRKTTAPGLLELRSPEALAVRRATVVFFGEGGGRFASRPDIEHEDVYDESRFGEALSERRLALDCSGDGRADLVEVGLDGSVAFHRVVEESGFFSGTSWSLERAPWKRLPAAGHIAEVDVLDLDGDGLGDVVSGAGERLTLVLSRRSGR